MIPAPEAVLTMRPPLPPVDSTVGQFNAGQVTTGQFTIGQFSTGQFTTCQFSTEKQSTGQFSTRQSSIGQFSTDHFISYVSPHYTNLPERLIAIVIILIYTILS